jgi:hypothetical protein
MHGVLTGSGDDERKDRQFHAEGKNLQLRVFQRETDMTNARPASAWFDCYSLFLYARFTRPPKR